MAQKDIIDKDKIEIQNSSFTTNNDPFNIKDPETKNVLRALQQLFTINKLAYTTQPIKYSTHWLDCLSLPLKDINAFNPYQSSPPHLLRLLKLVYDFYVDINFADINFAEIKELRERIVQVKGGQLSLLHEELGLEQITRANNEDLKDILNSLDKSINILNKYIKDIRVTEIDKDKYVNVGIAYISSNNDIQIIQNTINSIAKSILNFYDLCIHGKHRVRKKNIKENTNIPTVIGSIFWDITDYKHKLDKINNDYIRHQAEAKVAQAEAEVKNKLQETKFYTESIAYKKYNFWYFGFGLLALALIMAIDFFAIFVTPTSNATQTTNLTNFYKVLPINIPLAVVAYFLLQRSVTASNLSRYYKDLAVKYLLLVDDNTSENSVYNKLNDDTKNDLLKIYLTPTDISKNKSKNKLSLQDIKDIKEIVNPNSKTNP